MWAEFEPHIVDSCSVVRSTGATNIFDHNQATMAGGAIYATDRASLNITCSYGLPWHDTSGCPKPMWAGNIAGMLGQQAGLKPLVEMLGYASKLRTHLGGQSHTRVCFAAF